MNFATKSKLLPSITTELLSKTNFNVDNAFSSSWKDLGFNSLLRKAKFSKRSGKDINQVVYLLMLFVWIKVQTIGMFSKDSLLSFSDMKKDVLYEALNKEDLNWRKLQLITAKKVINLKAKTTAFIVDDCVKTRTGKSMPGVSSHFDHLTSRCVMGQQILTLGLANEEQFVPLDNEIFISNSKEQMLDYKFKDERSIAAKRYKLSQTQTKPEMVISMIKRAQQSGIEADYFLADAWFGTKKIIKMTEEQSLIAIVRMKKNKMKYRLTKNGVTYLFNSQELFKEQIKGNWERVQGVQYQSKSIIVELNLATTKDEPDHWTKVKLLYVRSLDEAKQKASKHDWALFLTTDTVLESTKILEVYALRWGIEVYFKEAKQKLGFLKEQSRHYAAYIASIHLTSLRFCLLLHAKKETQAASVSCARTDIEETLTSLNFASKLWCVFKAIITGSLSEMLFLTGKDRVNVLASIENSVTQFFEETMQMDSFTLRQEALQQ